MSFFSKMAAVDQFIILTECQFSKGKFQNRFEVAGEWYTMSVARGLVALDKKIYVNPLEDWAAIKCRLPQFSGVLSHFDQDIGSSLVMTNVQIIKGLALLLGIKTPTMLAGITSLLATERLVKICKDFGADTYLSGSSGRKYMDLSLFEEAGIKVEFQDLTEQDQRSCLEAIHVV